jgi:hypothetical protein
MKRADVAQCRGYIWRATWLVFCIVAARVLADNVEDENCIIPSATKKKDQQNNTNKHFFFHF